MKEELKEIYCDLSAGKLSQEEALGRIEALRLRPQDRRVGMLLFAPAWKDQISEIFAQPFDSVGIEQHIVVCDSSTLGNGELELPFPRAQTSFLDANENKNIGQRYTEYALECFERIQGILRSEPDGKVLMQVVVPDHEERTIFAGLSGLLKTASLENPQFVGQVILVPGEISAEELGRRLQQEKGGDLEPLVRYRQEVRQVLSWQEAPALEAVEEVFRDGGVYLITGGLGGLGTVFAKAILSRTRRSRVVLTGRKAWQQVGEEKQLLLRSLAPDGERVSYRQLDVEHPVEVKQLMAAVQQEYGQLNGILHSAGMIADNYVVKKTGSEFKRVLGPKVTGTYNLDAATKDMELDFLVLFSSIASVIGNAGQADYASANGFMDQFAAYRNRLVAAGERHGRTRSIHWPLWQDGGMRLDADLQAVLRERTGLEAMETRSGVSALHRSFGLLADEILILEGNVRQLRRVFLSGSLDQVSSPVAVQGALPLATVADRDSEALVEKAQDYVRRQCSEVLRMPAHKIDPQARLENYGVDSILAVKLTNQLERVLGPLSKTLFFEYQTIQELAKYLTRSHSTQMATLVSASPNGKYDFGAQTLTSRQPSVARSPARLDVSKRFSHSASSSSHREVDGVAMIGLSGRYAGAAGLREYWRNLREGKDCIEEVPKERWDWREYFSEDRSKSGHHYSKWGGFIAGIDEFDPLFFNISPKEAKNIDPQERLFLQHAWMAVEDAGYTRAGLQVGSEADLPGQVGVYVGVMYSEYQLFGVEASIRGNSVGVPGSFASIANRVSYVLNVHGPSMTVDTMCSSSLTAIDLACQELKLGRIGMAIAGGVNVSIHANKYLMLSAVQAISSQGRCQSFGEGGDGYVPGEGVGVVVLKRLAEAERDGDHIYGVIRGSALNHGGKTNGYTVPNPQAQASVIRRALSEAKTEARCISYIEAHGTGTKLGDPIEIAALNQAFQWEPEAKQYCAIGSVKSNIGHCESAAGMAGLTKVLLQMQHGQLVPSLHAERLNPYIDFERSAFVVNRELRAWERPVVDGREHPRVAGISSFGAGGSNAHVIVEEYVGQTRERSGEGGEVVIVLSARTAEQLEEKVRELLEWMGEEQGAGGREIDVESMAYTLQVGREGMGERVGLVVKTVGELEKKLAGLLSGQEMEGVYRGEGKRNNEDGLRLFSSDEDMQEAVGKWMEKGKYGKLLELWVKGVEVDWGRMYGERKPGRLSLPTYPFARERYWIEGVGSGKVELGGLRETVLHPLVQRNTSDLSEQRYSTTLTGEEFFLRDHELANEGQQQQKVLPAAAYLEMARAGIEQACAERREGAELELRDVMWAEPLVVQESLEVRIALQREEANGIGFEIYSVTGGEEKVHCQGRGEWSRSGGVEKLDVEQLQWQMVEGDIEPGQIYASLRGMGVVHGPSMQVLKRVQRGSKQVLAELSLPIVVSRTSGEYVLHPSLLDGALQASVGLMEGERADSGAIGLPYALEAIRIRSSCREAMWAWVRYAEGSQQGDAVVKVDIDLCDEQGQVCVQMRGVSWEAQGARVWERETNPGRGVAVGWRRELVVRTGGEKEGSGVATSKPRGVLLAELGEGAGIARQQERVRPAIRLHEPSGAVGGSGVRLLDCGGGLYRVELSGRGTREVREGIEGLVAALARIKEEEQLKVVMIVGMEEWLGGGREAYNLAVEEGLYGSLVSISCPVIAVTRGDVRGASLLGVAVCDLLVGNEEAIYGYGEQESEIHGSAGEERVLSERFGGVQTWELLSWRGEVRGRELRKKGWTCLLVPAGAVERQAEQLARKLAGHRAQGLCLLKEHLGRGMAKAVAALKPVAARLAVRVEFRVGVIELRAGPEGIGELRESLTRIREEGNYGAVVLRGGEEEFLPWELGEAEIEAWQGLIAGLELPVVAAVRGDARGWSWIASQCCDAQVFSRSGVYGMGGMPLSEQGAAWAGALLSHRLGMVMGREMLLTGAEYEGSELEELGLEVAEGGEVMARAQGLAEQWAGQSRSRVRAWKAQRAEELEQQTAERARRMKEAGEDRGEEAREEEAASGEIRLASEVVRATVHVGGIVVVRMEDRQAKNMFSAELVSGLREAFARIESGSGYKVVILTGYGSYFASGGTKESLLSIQSGKARFTDDRIFAVAQKCKLPVIAAMQGHGIGAGWTLGLMADVVLMSEESVYMSPYMSYGFTPGAGATWMLGRKLGADIGRESLLSGEGYRGEELKRRGVLVRVLPRGAVEAAAMGLARQMVRRSGEQLRRLKQQWSVREAEELEETYQRELAMHEQTFVGQAETLDRIEKNFYHAAPEQAGTEKAREPEAVSVMDEGEALRGVTGSLKQLLASELQMDEREIDEDVEFVELGMDSIIGVTWIRKINQRYETSIEATRVYSYPTLRQLSRYVKEEVEKLGTLAKVAKEREPAGALVSAILQKKESREGNERGGRKLRSWRRGERERFGNSSRVGWEEAAARGSGEKGTREKGTGEERARIAVIGMAGRFPRSRNLEEYWRNLAEGNDCITEVGGERWEVDAYYQAGRAVAGKSNSRWAGEVEGYDRFDPLFFNISPTEAESMDPQQRLFLEACWHSVEDAGYDAGELSGSKCGVFVGCASGDYHQRSRQHQLSAQGFTGGAMSILAARIAYFLNLRGPCLSIDTACSSSLVALANACDSLRNGSSEVALAGGVYVMTGPELHIRTSQAGMLSAEGRCYTFDQRANGFVPGEGVGVLLLKRLQDAERDGDLIYGEIAGWGVNQDGKSNGITAPNPESQTRLEQEVYEGYGIDVESIQLMEAHGTGTKLGDPVEVEGLKKAFVKYTSKEGYCALGSSKSNIGHCLTAAGVAGVIKVLLALKHRQLPPTINFEQLNEHIALQGSPFYVNQRLQEWKLNGGSKRQGAVSSFGFSGTNAHVVLGEYEGVQGGGLGVEAGKGSIQVMVLLSARTEERLKQKAEELLVWLERTSGVDLEGLAYTLQVGRTGMEQRVGWLVSSFAELREKLKAYSGGQGGLEDIYQGDTNRHKEALAPFRTDQDLQQAVAKWLANKKLSRLLGLWVQGLDLDWKKLYGDKAPRRLRLPLYPFARERYWIDGEHNERPEGVESVSTGRLHPLQETDLVPASSVPRPILLASPMWQVISFDMSGPAIGYEYKQHQLILCDLPGIDPEQLGSLVHLSNCILLRTGNHIGQRYTEYALECFERIQGILRSEPDGKVLMQVVVPDHEERTIFAGLSGLLKTASLENPQFVGQVILVPGEISAEELGRRLQQEKGGALEPLVRYRQEVRQVLSWQEAPALEAVEEVFRDGGVYLITGGLGGLGMVFAKEILSRTRRSRVVLTGRKAWQQVGEEKQLLLRSLAPDGERVSYRQLDVEHPVEVKQLMAAVQQEYGQLNGILHSAGMIADNYVVKKTGSEFKRVLGPKVTGTYNLDAATKDMELDFLVLFSSIASVIGNAGQADYASANGFMDQFAAYRNRLVAAGERHGRTRSIHWPLWQDGGMATDPSTRQLLQQITGMQAIGTNTGLEAFYQSITLPFDQTLVLQGDEARLARHLANLSTSSLEATDAPSTNGLVRGQEPIRNAMHGNTGASQQAPNVAGPPIRLTLLREDLRAILAGVLGLRSQVVDLDRPFVELGLDSFLAVQMMVAINNKYGTGLSNSKLFDHPTINRLSVLLQQELEAIRAVSGLECSVQTPNAPVKVSGDIPVTERNSHRDSKVEGNFDRPEEKVAIIGMSGRYPEADNLRQYWGNLMAARNSIVEVPRQRFDLSRYYDPDRAKAGKTNSKWLGAIDGIECFDPLFFRISPHEAEHMDPQHRLFLQEAYRTFEDAGYSSSSLSSKLCGVYLGISTNEYGSLLWQKGITSAPVTSNSYAIGAARIAYYLNLKGPAISVDTACSSSLVAIHLASQALLNREIDMALAGGVSLWLAAESYLVMGQAGMFSSQGQCRAFDDGADGIVNGEGVGAVLLKRLSDAQRDDDLIYGVIAGSGINQDGKTNGITAPSVSSQAELERSVYARYKIDPETIGYVEAHGTGTKLGDPIELEALATVFQEKTSRRNFCALASVKSNIGHTSSAAGIAALHKVLLSLRHRTLVPTLNVSKGNSYFDFIHSPFYISRETKTWEVTAGSLRRAAMSSFGFSGTNAHLVVEEYLRPAQRFVIVGANPMFIVPLSARTREQLQQKARDLLEFLCAEQLGQVAFQGPGQLHATVELSALAYTLQIGREAMEERLGFVVSSVAELSEKLTRYLNGEKNIDGTYQGRLDPDDDRVTAMVQDDDMRQAIGRWITGQKFSTLLDWWTRGLNFDWNNLYPDGKPQRMSLPTYPFARERYWISSTPEYPPADTWREEDLHLKSIEDIITKLEDEMISSDQAVRELKILV